MDDQPRDNSGGTNRRGFLALCLAAGVVGDLGRATSPWTAGQRVPGWAASSGRHYDVDETTEGRPPFRTIRAPTFHRQPGFGRDVTDRAPADRPADVTAVEGPFSGETRYYDFGSVDRAGSMAAQVKRATRNGRDSLMLIDGEPIRRLRRNPAQFKDTVYAAATFFNTGAFADDPTLHWQVGNEPNDVAHFNPRGIVLDGDESVWDYFNDPRQADLYVDLFLAPAVAALRRAEADLPAGSPSFTVMPGGIGLINAADSHDWLERVLERRPSRSRAPGLGGAPMKEHVDVIAIHYAFVPPFDDADYDYTWRETLRKLNRRWVRTDEVDGVWHTEEGGYGSWGASHLVFAMPRFIEWWGGRRWTPDRARLIWWPAPDGPDADSNAAERLQAALVDLWNGRSRLVDLSNRTTVGSGGSESRYDAYAFATDGRYPRLGAFVSPALPERSGDPAASAAPPFSTSRIGGVPESFDPADYSVAARVVRPERLRPVDVRMDVVTTPNRALRITHSRLRLKPSETLVVLVDRGNGSPFSASN